MICAFDLARPERLGPFAEPERPLAVPLHARELVAVAEDGKDALALFAFDALFERRGEGVGAEGAEGPHDGERIGEEEVGGRDREVGMIGKMRRRRTGRRGETAVRVAGEEDSKLCRRALRSRADAIEDGREEDFLEHLAVVVRLGARTVSSSNVSRSLWSENAGHATYVQEVDPPEAPDPRES